MSDLSSLQGKVAVITGSTQGLGETTARHMVDVSADEAGFRLRGLATLPLVSRGNRSHQFLYLGRRPVEDRQVSHAIAQAIKMAPQMDRDQVLLINLSGRGDKDMHTVAAREGMQL